MADQQSQDAQDTQDAGEPREGSRWYSTSGWPSTRPGRT